MHCITRFEINEAQCPPIVEAEVRNEPWGGVIESHKFKPLFVYRIPPFFCGQKWQTASLRWIFRCSKEYLTFLRCFHAVLMRKPSKRQRQTVPELDASCMSVARIQTHMSTKGSAQRWCFNLDPANGEDTSPQFTSLEPFEFACPAEWLRSGLEKVKGTISQQL